MNYKIPIDFSRLFESDIRNLDVQSEKDSIRQNLELIINTHPGEHKYSPEFGCKIWDLDFKRAGSRGVWEEQFARFITEGVTQYETRIHDIEVHVGFVDVKREDLSMGATFIKAKANIKIHARMINTGERFKFSYSLFLGPLNPDLK